MKCENKKVFDCPAIESPDVKSVNFTIAPTKVPARETTLMCAVFKVCVSLLYYIYFLQV